MQNYTGRQCPSISASFWMNTSPLIQSDWAGKVVLIDFWDYTCMDCVRALPIVNRWYRQYRDRGVIVLGVHASEFSFGRNPRNVENALRDYGIGYPVILDADYGVWNLFGAVQRPRKILVDRGNVVQYDSSGPSPLEPCEHVLRKSLLGEEEAPGEEAHFTRVLPRDERGDGKRFLQVYTGYEKGAIGNAGQNTRNKELVYRDNGSGHIHTVYAEGLWRWNDERIEHVTDTEQEDYIRMAFDGESVFAVCVPEDRAAVPVYVSVDDDTVGEENKGADILYDKQGRSYLWVDEPRIYHILRYDSAMRRTVRLIVARRGLGIYRFIVER